MTLTERIEKLEQDYQQATQQINDWTAARLRIEGALLTLRAMRDEGVKGRGTDAESTVTANPTTTTTN